MLSGGGFNAVSGMGLGLGYESRGFVLGKHVLEERVSKPGFEYDPDHQGSKLAPGNARFQRTGCVRPLCEFTARLLY